MPRKQKTILCEESVLNSYLEIKNAQKVAKHYKTSVKEIKAILEKNGIILTLRKQPLNIEYFKKIDSCEKAYWLGFIQADGHLKKGGYKLTFCMNDEDILFKFQKAIGAGSPVRKRINFDKRTNKNYTSYSLQICSKEFCNYIKSHGVDEDKSKKFSFPKIKEKYYSHFVRGIFDGDGCLFLAERRVKKHKQWRVSLILTNDCANFIKDYLFKIGIKRTYIHRTDRYSFPLFFLNIYKDSIKFLDWIYKGSTKETRLDRKHSKFLLEKPLLKIAREIVIKNLSSNEIFLSNSLRAFCFEHDLDAPFMMDIFLKNKTPKKGRHVNWRILEIKNY